MLVLVVDSSTPAVTAALVRVQRGPASELVPEPGSGLACEHTVTLLAERVTVDGRAHAELLAPQVQAVLAEAGARPADLAAVVAGVGPGPFTGLRVGMVTAAAFAHALAVPVYGVCSLDGIGHDLPGRVLAASDARRKEIYWAVYHDGARVAGPCVGKPDAVDVTGLDRAAGDGAARYAAVLGLDVQGPPYPVARALAVLAADRVLAKAPGETLVPLYLRRPDAVAPGERKPALR